MRRLPVLIVLALALVALAIPAVGATASARTSAAAKTKACAPAFTEGRAARSLYVTGITCSQGRVIANHVAGTAPAGCVKFTDKKGHVKLVSPCAYKGYRCTARATGQGRALDVTCKNGAKRLTFQY